MATAGGATRREMAAADISSDDALADACLTFSRNSFPVLSTSAKIVSALLSNLAKEDTVKFRRVNLDNTKVKAAMNAEGATEILLAAGFEPVEGAAALESKGSNASSKAAEAAAALDAALASCENASFALRLVLPHGGAGVR